MKIYFCLLMCLLVSLNAHADEMKDHAQHNFPVSDNRQMLNYPPDVRTHALANMRSHLNALAEMMNAFANGKYTEAADIADSHLGMKSTGATACKPDTTKRAMETNMKMPAMTETDHLNHQMAQLMPDKMRELGQNMHKSANDFAAKARNAAKDSKYVQDAALALARIPQNCVACHEVYRMQ